MSDQGQDGSMDQPRHPRDKRRLMITQDDTGLQSFVVAVK